MAFTKAEFISQCKREFGGANPDRMYRRVWEHLVRNRQDVYFVRRSFGLPTTLEEAHEKGEPCPDWCFKRFGMSETRMPDGRIICIGGEHEDHYDPNFCIYNDVVVIRPAAGKTALGGLSGEVEIYGYPREVFAPTDFHSATLVAGHIYIIGRLGYLEDRSVPSTPVYRLDTDSYRIEQVSTSGPSPGLIHEHHAEFEPESNSILVRGGRLDAAGTRARPWNHAVHRLHLSEGRWELIREHERHRRFLLNAPRGNMIDATIGDVSPKRLPFWVVRVEDEVVSRFQLAVGGIRVTYEEIVDIRMHVEGDLPEETLAVLLEDVLENLSVRSKAEWTATEVESFESP